MNFAATWFITKNKKPTRRSIKRARIRPAYAHAEPPFLSLGFQASKMLGGPTRNIALWQDRLFLATYDAAIVAIDAQSGVELWRTEKADYREAFTHSAGPIMANGIVVSGINGCELFTQDGCFITGHDPETGEEL